MGNEAGPRAFLELGEYPIGRSLKRAANAVLTVIATDKLTGYLLIAGPLDDKSKFFAECGLHAVAL